MQVLGTLITEWDAGAEACLQLFGSPAAATQAARQLAAVAVARGFDGWLVNIENELRPEHVAHVLTFLRRAGPYPGKGPTVY
jgi:mannosyl-glycoprotein endo-beta-N-acetylglucosaminidase